MIRAILGVVVLLVAACSVAGQGQTEPKDKKAIVQQVFDAWKERRTKVKTVRYTVSGEMIIPKGTIPPDGFGPTKAVAMPKANLSSLVKVMMLLDFDKQRYHQDKEESGFNASTSRLEPQMRTTTFDGKENWEVFPREVNARGPDDPDAVVVTGNFGKSGFTAEDWPFFIAHGMVPTTGNHITPGRFQPKIDQGEFYYHGSAVHAGRNCVVLRTELDHFTGKGFDEYWVDMARGGAVLRQVAYMDNFANLDLDVQYQETPAGWLLATWSVQRREPAHLQNPARTWRIHKFRVDSYELDPAVSPADFRATLTPGMKVWKFHLGGNPDSIAQPTTESEQTFVVTENGSLRQTGGKPTPTSYFWWVVGGGVAFVLLLFGWLWRGRQKVAPKQ